ncbi:MAG: GSCFA family protein, partial [Thalassobium sp.]
SFEIITSHALGGPWFGDNKRTVRPEGVARVMQLFLAAHGLAPHPVANAPAPQREDDEDDDLFCDELLLDAFAK